MLSFKQIQTGSMLLVGLTLIAGCAHATDVKDYVVLKNGQSTGATCGNASFSDQALFQMFPDGSYSEDPFRIPERRFLKITDVEWSAFGTQKLGSLSPGYTIRLRIALEPVPSQHPPIPRLVFLSRGLTIGELAKGGRPGSTEYMTTGFVVAPGATICPDILQETESGGATVRIDQLILRGYLVDGP